MENAACARHFNRWLSVELIFITNRKVEGEFCWALLDVKARISCDFSPSFFFSQVFVMELKVKWLGSYKIISNTLLIVEYGSWKNDQIICSCEISSHFHVEIFISLFLTLLSWLFVSVGTWAEVISLEIHKKSIWKVTDRELLLSE